MVRPSGAPDGPGSDTKLLISPSKWQTRIHPGDTQGLGAPGQECSTQSWDHCGQKHGLRAPVKRILNDHGIEPAPERGSRTPWKTFLHAHWNALAALDFFTVEVLTFVRIIRYYILFVIRLKIREVEIVGITAQPCEKWMKQMARSPNLNAFAERFVLSIKSECLNKIIPLGEKHLRQAIREFMGHYHAERNHQGFGSRIIRPDETIARSHSVVKTRSRLGGLLNYYYREAA